MKKETWHGVVSSNLSAVRYDEAAQHLDIRFIKGTVFRYFRVPKEVTDGLITAPSAGRFFAERIKKVFDAEKLQEGM